jgi:hypothetical protein
MSPVRSCISTEAEPPVTDPFRSAAVYGAHIFRMPDGHLAIP